MKDLLLMLVNFDNLLGGKGSLGHITTENVDKVLSNIPKRISQYLKTNDTKELALHPINNTTWPKIQLQINKGIDSENLEIGLANVAPELKDDLVVAITEAIAQLKALMPVNVSVTLTGLDERQPSNYEQNKFMRGLRIVENPALILDLIDANAVTGTELDTLEQFYPTYFDELKLQIMSALAEMKGKDSEYQLSMAKNRTLSAILGVSRVTPSTMAKFQQKAEAEDPSNKADITIAKSVGTDTQRVANK